MKKIATLIGLMSICVLSAFAKPTFDKVNINFDDGRSEVRKLEKRPDGAMRLRLPADILHGAHVDISSDTWNAKKGEKGWYLFSPGALLRFTQDNGSLRFPFVMSAFCAKTERVAFMAIPKTLSADSFAHYEVKDGNYKLFMRLHTINFGKRAPSDLVVDFYEFKGKDANYSAMGRKYRQWRLSETGALPLRERVKNNPYLRNTVDNILVRFKHGVKPVIKSIERQTPENEPKPHIMFTFEEMENFIIAMKAAGIETADIHSVGWNIRGHDGRWPQMFPVEELWGGEKKLRKAIQTAKKLGYQIGAHTNYTGAFQIAENWNEDLLVRGRDMKFLRRGVWAGGLSHRQCPKQAFKMNFIRDCQKITELGFYGMCHIDVVTCARPEACFAPEHACTRAETEEAWRKFMVYGRKKFGSFSSEASYDFAGEDLDFAFYVSAYPTFLPETKGLEIEIVPFWQIAWHGIILSNPFWNTVDPTSDFDREEKIPFMDAKFKRVLKLVEFGGRPCFYWTNYRKMGVAPIKEAYDLYQPLKYLQYEFLDEHCELAKGVYLSRYSDGSETVVNYSDKDFSYKSEVVKARNYKLFKAK